MGSPLARWLVLIGATIIVFGVVVAVGLQVLPSPHSETDYLVVGTIATLLALGVMFAVLITTWNKAPNPFARRRQPADAETPEAPAGKSDTP